MVVIGGFRYLRQTHITFHKYIVLGTSTATHDAVMNGG